jgi:hypothetical protein
VSAKLQVFQKMKYRTCGCKGDCENDPFSIICCIVFNSVEWDESSSFRVESSCCCCFDCGDVVSGSHFEDANILCFKLNAGLPSYRIFYCKLCNTELLKDMEDLNKKAERKREAYRAPFPIFNRPVQTMKQPKRQESATDYYRREEQKREQERIHAENIKNSAIRSLKEEILQSKDPLVIIALRIKLDVLQN